MQLYHQNETYLEQLDLLLAEMDALNSELLLRVKRKIAPRFDPPARSTVSAFVDQFVNLLVSR